MGLLDSLRGSDPEDPGDDNDPTWGVIATNLRNGQRHSYPDAIDEGEWRFEDKISKEVFQFEYGDVLENGVKYQLLQVNEKGHPDFDTIEWTIEMDEIPQDDQIARLERRLEELAGPGGMTGEQDVAEQALEGMLAGRVNPETAREIIDLKAEYEQKTSETGHNFFQDADPGNRSEVMTATLMQLMSGYDDLGEVVEDLGGGLMSAAGPDVGPGAQVPPQQMAGELAAAQEANGQEARADQEQESETTPMSSNRAKFEDKIAQNGDVDGGTEHDPIDVEQDRDVVDDADRVVETTVENGDGRDVQDDDVDDVDEPPADDDERPPAEADA